MPGTLRDLRLDFFRGLALIFIFIDHIPDNFLSYFTLESIGFYDAAEVFIFISGFTAAVVYGQRLASRGALYATAQILRRAWTLYVAHIFLFMIFIAEVSYTVTAFNNPMYNDEMGIADFLTQPHVAVIKALLLAFQPTFLDILPLYIVLLALFPAVLLGLRWRPLVVLVPSFALYVIVQITGITIPAYPEGHVWFFNPLAWQFLFISGAALGYGGLHGVRWPVRLRPLYLPALALCIAALVVRVSWTMNGVWDAVPPLLLKLMWFASKNNLSPVRLVPFLAAVLVVAVLVPPEAAFLRWRLARPLLRCGQQSLEIFCLSILLSALGHFVLSEYDSGIIVQIIVNLVGITAMLLTARLLDWYRAMDRTPPRPLSVAGGGPGVE